MATFQITQVELVSRQEVRVVVEANGERHTHLLTVGSPIRIIQAGPDMNVYPDEIIIEASRQAAVLLWHARAQAA